MNPTIRPATASDIPAIQAVGASAWRDTYTGLVPDGYIEAGLEHFWSYESFERALTSGDTRLLVAELEGRVVGVIRLTYTEDGVAHLGQLYLLREARRQGLGQALWKTATATLPSTIRRYRTSVVEGVPALRFYEQLGFNVTNHERPTLRGYTVPLIVLEKQVNPDDLTRVDYVASELSYNCFLRPAHRAALARLKLPPGSSGLDLGCGPGGLLTLLDEVTGQCGQIVGVDVSRPHLAAAQQMIEAQGLGGRVRLEWADLRQALPFADASFDWVWCADVLWPGRGLDPLAAVREAARVTRPGGQVAIWFLAPERGIFLPGEPALEQALRIALVETLYPVVPTFLHHETAITWLRAAGLVDLQVSAHPTEVGAPLDEAVLGYLESYLMSALRRVPRSALRTPIDEATWTRWQLLSDPGAPEYLLRQPEYYCVQLGLLASGRVAG